MKNLKELRILKSAFFLMILTGAIFSQNINNLFVIYGFQAPFLESGEFVLNTFGNYNWGESDGSQNDNPDYSYITESKSSEVYANGLLAVTDNILVNAGLSIFPELDTRSTVNKNTDYLYKSNSSRDTYFEPFVSLIYRPMKNLEVSGFYSNNNRNTSSDNSNNTTISTTDYNNSEITFHVNYFGKLWNK